MAYWAMLSFIHLLELVPIVNYITVLPFYALVKFFVIFSLMNPLTESAKSIYSLHLKKTLKRHKSAM